MTFTECMWYTSPQKLSFGHERQRHNFQAEYASSLYRH